MDLKEIKEILHQVVAHDISEFEYEESGFKIKVKRQVAAVAHASASESQALSAFAPVNPAENLAPHAPLETQEAQGLAQEDLYIVVSPIVGTFFRAANPNSEPFVKLGDAVEEGSVLCIIEAMKLMNEIKSDVSGEVVNIFIENGQPVEYGQQLFALRKNGSRNLPHESGQVMEKSL